MSKVLSSAVVGWLGGKGKAGPISSRSGRSGCFVGTDAPWHVWTSGHFEQTSSRRQDTDKVSPPSGSACAGTAHLTWRTCKRREAFSDKWVFTSLSLSQWKKKVPRATGRLRLWQSPNVQTKRDRNKPGLVPAGSQQQWQKHTIINLIPHQLWTQSNAWRQRLYQPCPKPSNTGTAQLKHHSLDPSPSPLRSRTRNLSPANPSADHSQAEITTNIPQARSAPRSHWHKHNGHPEIAPSLRWTPDNSQTELPRSDTAYQTQLKKLAFVHAPAGEIKSH